MNKCIYLAGANTTEMMPAPASSATRISRPRSLFSPSPSRLPSPTSFCLPPMTALSMPLPAPKAILQLARDLLVMADKYQVQHLKDLCQKFLLSNLNWDNSLSTYTFAYQHNAKQIIDLALTLITTTWTSLLPGRSTLS
ncbi:BTB/POZ domain-containing protein [Prunus yedoensis var. nudiflora]|uniref:BTB/POZ domain-containing protein n=1 Tax=Prunus yedoensis var. nudiflora TaxID=2094558 RepID=A0A314Y8Z4_PRUYE|nr:BTB/POZ domain-containing protein [Prunus yedoensis var. nudiflora]